MTPKVTNTGKSAKSTIPRLYLIMSTELLVRIGSISLHATPSGCQTTAFTARLTNDRNGKLYTFTLASGVPPRAAGIKGGQDRRVTLQIDHPKIAVLSSIDDTRLNTLIRSPTHADTAPARGGMTSR